MDKQTRRDILRATASRKIPLIIAINSADRRSPGTTSSANFSVDLPNDLHAHNFDIAHFLSATLPNFYADAAITNEPLLLLEVPQFNPNVMTTLGRQFFDILRFNYTIPATDPYIRTTKFDIHGPNMTIENRGKLQELTVRLYDPRGGLFSFGQDSVIAASFSAANPTTVTTAVAHGLTTGDRIFIREFSNASSEGLRDFIERSAGHIITVTGGSTFTVTGMDLSGESASQVITGEPGPYALGFNARLAKLPEPSAGYIPGPMTFGTGAVTTVTTPNAHGLTTGDTVRFYDFDNGSTRTINDLFNQKNVVTVTGANTFTVPINTAGEAASQVKTYSRPAFTLGNNAVILDASRQTYFEFYLEGYKVDTVEPKIMIP